MTSGVALPSTVAFAVLFNGGLPFSGGGLTWTYVAVPTLSSVVPASGPAVASPTTVVTVSGADFLDPTGQLQCRFGAGQLVAGTLSSGTQVECAVPGSLGAAAGPVAVEVTSNGVDFTGPSGVMYTYYTPIELDAASPSVLPTALAGKAVTVSGDFFSTSSLVARFDDGAGGVVSVQTTACTAPVLTASVGTEVQVTVANDGGQRFGPAVADLLVVADPRHVVVHF
jgi:hypothetical protein